MLGYQSRQEKILTFILEKKTKQKQNKNPWRKWEESEYLNAKEIKKGIQKIVHDLPIEKRMWEIDEKNPINQIRMIKSKGWVTNIEIETIRKKLENEGRDEIN